MATGEGFRGSLLLGLATLLLITTAGSASLVPTPVAEEAPPMPARAASAAEGAPALALSNPSVEAAVSDHRTTDRRVLLLHLDDRNLSQGRGGYLNSLQRAADYWENDPERMLKAAVDLVWVEEAERADVRVRFLDRQHLTCGDSHQALGCGRAPTANRTGKTEITLRADGDRTPRSYTQVEYIARHELGHALGLGHTQGHDNVMNSKAPPDPLWAPGPQATSLLWLSDPPVLLALLGTVMMGRGVWGAHRCAPRGLLELVSELETAVDHARRAR